MPIMEKTQADRPKKSKLDILPQVTPPTMVAIQEGYVIMGTSLEQVANMLEYEDWAEEWYSRNLFEIEQPHSTNYSFPLLR
jgi:hypothetical protein